MEVDIYHVMGNIFQECIQYEWMHLYYFAGDIAYERESDYIGLSTRETLFNAESFAELVNDLCP